MTNISSRLSRLALSAATLLAPVMVGCNDLKDDDHYGDISTVIDNPELNIVSQSSQDYIADNPDYSAMTSLLREHGIFDELASKGQLSTILLVEDENFALPDEEDPDMDKFIRAHVSDVSISPANLMTTDKLMMWHGKFVNIDIDDEGRDGHIIGHIKFNKSVVKEVVQTQNGYIYVISEPIYTPTSLLDFINNLPEEYSIFKDLVLSSGGKKFDRDNSRPIGVNSEGNTVYDSVFITTNAHFENVGVDLNSESLTATMLLPSNKVIQDALEDAHSRLGKWSLTRSDDVLRNWILDVCFFKKRYAVDQLLTSSSDDAADINSMFSKQWRSSTKFHELESEEASKELSNGVVHYVKKIHIPNNVLVYRLKDYFYYYESCTEDQKNTYYRMINMAFKNCKQDVDYWTPLAGVWPAIRNYSLHLGQGEDGPDSSLTLDFTPIHMSIDENGATVIEPYLIPPGSYRLAFGSTQNQDLQPTFTVLVNGVAVAKSDGKIDLSAVSSTFYHYDRGAQLSNTYPEGYNPTEVRNAAGDTATKKEQNYDTDGGLAINEVTIPDVNGDGSGVKIVIRIECDSWLSKTDFCLHHWCLRPTVNNY